MTTTTRTNARRPAAPEGYSVCFGSTGCGETKPVAEFTVRRNKNTRTDGTVSVTEVLNPLCRPCQSRASNAHITPERKREQALKRNYGITPADWDTLFAYQGGRCYLCERPEAECPALAKGREAKVSIPTPQEARRRLIVEHDHTTGHVRSLACEDCNRLLGGLESLPRPAVEQLASLRVLNYIDGITPAWELGIGQHGKGIRRAEGQRSAYRHPVTGKRISYAAQAA